MSKDRCRPSDLLWGLSPLQALTIDRAAFVAGSDEEHRVYERERHRREAQRRR